MDGAYLMQQGVPYEAVFGPVTKLSPSRRYAFVVATGELKGGEFDWDARPPRWKKKG